jgi:hypothetical protein
MQFDTQSLQELVAKLNLNFNLFVDVFQDAASVAELEMNFNLFAVSAADQDAASVSSACCAA